MNNLQKQYGKLSRYMLALKPKEAVTAESKYVTIEQIASKAGVNRAAMYSHWATHRRLYPKPAIEGIRGTRKTMWLASDVDAFIEARKANLKKPGRPKSRNRNNAMVTWTEVVIELAEYDLAAAVWVYRNKVKGKSK